MFGFRFPITLAQVVAALGFTPANKAGDTITGILTLASRLIFSGSASLKGVGSTVQVRTEDDSGFAHLRSATVTVDASYQTKQSAPGAGPGAGVATLYWVAGTNPGTGKLIAVAGTSSTPVTIVDNVGTGF